MANLDKPYYRTKDKKRKGSTNDHVSMGKGGLVKKKYKMKQQTRKYANKTNFIVGNHIQSRQPAPNISGSRQSLDLDIQTHIHEFKKRSFF